MSDQIDPPRASAAGSGGDSPRSPAADSGGDPTAAGLGIADVPVAAEAADEPEPSITDSAPAPAPGASGATTNELACWKCNTKSSIPVATAPVAPAPAAPAPAPPAPSAAPAPAPAAPVPAPATTAGATTNQALATVMTEARRALRRMEQKKKHRGKQQALRPCNTRRNAKRHAREVRAYQREALAEAVAVGQGGVEAVAAGGGGGPPVAGGAAAAPAAAGGATKMWSPALRANITSAILIKQKRRSKRLLNGKARHAFRRGGLLCGVWSGLNFWGEGSRTENRKPKKEYRREEIGRLR
ncbi:hypothetical protein QBC37DRAFT_403208 [Rhypophila decipiens]|uniref:Uncharacterized protein n=1 Tax=Rhypophila decipiens TaxID=261697 RepID=A0AAN6Y3K1_9PEZI|nr:hypothetical protein QBC37DRAFT_403208 [Rhypophila decipiens]